MSSFVRMDAQAVAAMFRSETGPVMRHLAVVASRIQDGAKQRVGVSEEGHGQVGGRQQHLRDAIVKRFVVGPSGPTYQVGAELPHAELHHEGTQPHEIVPVRARVLRFTVGGVTVFAKRVQHPGTKPNRYLTDAAAAEGLKVKLIGH